VTLTFQWLLHECCVGPFYCEPVLEVGTEISPATVLHLSQFMSNVIHLKLEKGSLPLAYFPNPSKCIEGEFNKFNVRMLTLLGLL